MKEKYAAKKLPACFGKLKNKIVSNTKTVFSIFMNRTQYESRLPQFS